MGSPSPHLPPPSPLPQPPRPTLPSKPPPRACLESLNPLDSSTHSDSPKRPPTPPSNATARPSSPTDAYPCSPSLDSSWARRSREAPSFSTQASPDLPSRISLRSLTGSGLSSSPSSERTRPPVPRLDGSTPPTAQLTSLVF